MQDYIPVTWSSEPLSLEKMQNMIQNDQSILEELEAKPRGIIGYAELTTYASNDEKAGYRDVNLNGFFLSPPDFTASTNKNTAIKEWTRVVDNWKINPNGLSAHVNVESARMLHLELYIPILYHVNPSPSTGSEASNWGIQGFKITRDGVDISGESLTDIWTSRGTTSKSIHSFYFDCYDVGATPGPHLYEVMWKSENGLHIAIWEQMRNTFTTLPDATYEPDQVTYLGNDAGSAQQNWGRYNISDFALPRDNAQSYKDPDGTGDSVLSADAIWGASKPTVNAPFAGGMPTAQFIITDCGSQTSIIINREDDTMIQDNTNAEPTA